MSNFAALHHVQRWLSVRAGITRSQFNIVIFMKKKQLLLVSDIVGYGKVGALAMLPVLTYMGVPFYALPTMLVSNPFEYGKFATAETTSYISDVLPVWRQLGFAFDAIATGIIASESQARLVSAYCREQAEGGTRIYVDPVMGDEGQLYNGITPDRIKCMREMVAVAHLIYPNMTEACYLTDTPYRAEGYTVEEMYAMIDRLRSIGTRSVLITSAIVDGQTSVAGYNDENDRHFIIPFTEIPVHFPGTGDIFSAVLLGHLLGGEPLEQSTRKAIDTMYRLIDANRNNTDKNSGIAVERYLSMIQEA